MGKAITSPRQETRSTKITVDRMDIQELLTALEYQTQQIGAISQAAIDYVHLREKVKPTKQGESMLQEHLNLAYQNLKDLVI